MDVSRAALHSALVLQGRIAKEHGIAHFMAVRDAKARDEVGHELQDPVEQPAPDCAKPQALRHEFKVRKIDERILLLAGGILGIGDDDGMGRRAEDHVITFLPESGGRCKIVDARVIRQLALCGQGLQTGIDFPAQGCQHCHVINDSHMQLPRTNPGGGVVSHIQQTAQQGWCNVLLSVLACRAAALDELFQTVGCGPARKRLAGLWTVPQHGDSTHRANRQTVQAAHAAFRRGQYRAAILHVQRTGQAVPGAQATADTGLAVQCKISLCDGHRASLCAYCCLRQLVMQ